MKSKIRIDTNLRGFRVRISYSHLIFLLSGIIFLTSCQSNKPESDLPLGSETPVSSAIPSSPTNTQISINLATHTPPVISDSSPTPSIIPSTPDFSLPLDPKNEITPWRPPVYPVPWVPSPFDHFYFLNPIGAYDIENAFSNYGYGDVFFENVVHTGIDIPGDIGTPILAAGEGKIIYAGQGVYRGGNNVYDDPYGKAVVIQHSFSYKGEFLYTLYAHLDDILVEEGQVVSAGQKIGLMGNTGKTTGPHLHFEVRVGKNEYLSSRNPDLWISPSQGWGILVGQILTYEGRLHEQQVVYLFRSEDYYAGDVIDDQLWIAKSYQNQAINSDPYYKENLTISNIPAGKYVLTIPVTDIGFSYHKEIEIKPGQVTFFKFNVWRGFSDVTPQPPEYDFSPSP